MAASSTTLHESEERLRAETVDRHRAVVSLIEELEAIDWYDQRIDATGNDELRAILAHNRDEEKEHAVMLLEWMRRGDPALDANLKKYLFAQGDIAAAEDESEPESSAQPGTDGSLGIGSLLGGSHE